MYFVRFTSLDLHLQRWCISLSVLIFCCHFCISQDSLHLLEPAPEFHKTRFYTGLGLGTMAYGAALYGLSSAWYEGTEKSRFHIRDDFGEWEHVDKAGHIFTNYFESIWVSRSLEWSGIPHEKAIWYGAGASLFFQTTIELLDGFSGRWGFSWSDMGANALGAAFFLGQDYLWREQRIQLKWSTQYIPYSTEVIYANNGLGSSSPLQRAENLYGNTTVERILKDYNGQSIWASVNIVDFLHTPSIWPKWLSVSVGFGAQNIYGGYTNTWTEQQATFNLNHRTRYQQFYIGPDVDWSKIKTHSRLLNTLFDMLNALRLPFPALELNTRGELIWHWMLL